MASLHKLPAPMGADPRIDLMDASVMISRDFPEPPRRGKSNRKSVGGERYFNGGARLWNFMPAGRFGVAINGAIDCRMHAGSK